MSDRGQSKPRGQALSPEAADAAAERRETVRKALERDARKLARKLDTLHGDLEEAERGPTWRRYGEVLLTCAHQVPPRAPSVELPGPGEPAHTLEIELDPAIAAPANAARYSKHAAKAERGQREIPPRVEAVRRELDELRAKLAKASTGSPPGNRASPGRNPWTRRCASAGSTACGAGSGTRAMRSASRRGSPRASGAA